MKQDRDLRSIIKSHQEEMTELELDIARYFLSPEAQQHSLSSSRVTELLHVSKAALTRFSQKCGFTGYREFIYHFNEETKSQKQQSPHDELTQNVLRRYQHVLQATENLAKDDQIKEVANLITQADRVYFFGKGSSGLVASEMKLRFLRLGVICEALTDQDGFAWTTSILDKSCLVIAFSLSGTTRSIIHSLLDAQEMGAKTVLLTAQPDAIKDDFTEILPVAPLPGSTYIDRITATLPFLTTIDLIYAHFLEMDRERKERIFNSYWENKKLNGYDSRRR